MVTGCRGFLLTCAAVAATTLSSCQDSGRPRVFLVDQNAGPNQGGAVFALDKRDGKWRARPFASSKLISRPQDILPEPDGSLLVVDYRDELGDGRLFRISADGERCEEIAVAKGLVDPVVIERAPDGSIWIIDKNADPLGLRPSEDIPTGTLWRLSKDLKTLEIIATGPPLYAPAAVCFHGDEAYLLDADSYRTHPYSAENGEGAIFRVRKHPQPLEPVVKFQRLISPFDLHRLPTGQFLIVDVNADPVTRMNFHGAIYLADPKTGKTTLFANHEELRDPVRFAMVDGELWFTDANSDPLGLGPDGSKFHFGGKGRGGIYALDTATKKIRLVLATKDFVNPLSIRVAPR